MMDGLTTHFLSLKPKYIKRSDLPNEIIENWKNEVIFIFRF